jgi:hypothetical protein
MGGGPLGGSRLRWRGIALLAVMLVASASAAEPQPPRRARALKQSTDATVVEGTTTNDADAALYKVAAAAAKVPSDCVPLDTVLLTAGLHSC